MVIAGIDVGAKNIKVVFVKDNIPVGKILIEAGIDRLASINEAYESLLEKNGLSKEEVDIVVSTGAGREVVDFAQKSYTIMACNAMGIARLLPTVRTVIDVGAEEARCVRLDENGKLVEFAINEKCAAGAGAFIESMARAMEVSIEEFARISLDSKRTIPINAQCAIFAESEVVSLVHSETDRGDIAKAVHDAMATRVGAMAQRVRMQDDMALIGGVAKSKGFIESLRAALKKDILVPEEPEFVSALGAALLGAKEL